MGLGLVFSFLSKPLMKYIGGGILIGLAVWFAVHQWNNFTKGLVEKGRLIGRGQVTQEYRAQVAENNKVNRLVEEKTGKKLDEFASKFDEFKDRLMRQEQTHTNTIEKQITNQPQIFNNKQCETPPETMNARNSIRALGPKGAQ